MQHRHIILHLSLIPGVGPITIANIIARFGSNLHEVYFSGTQDFIELSNNSIKGAQALVQGLADQSLLERELKLLEKYGIHYLTILDDDFPPLLKEIYACPPVLYIQGAGRLHTNFLSIVGSRKANAYAKQVIQQFIPTLINYGWAIVSGGARGVDTMAHQATIDAGGHTIAVLGSGLLKPYPAENKRLFGQIIEKGGLIVSPFPLQAAAQPGNFPARNRIISGLSQGCLVVQAAEQSGARITALYALEQGRSVFAIPGQIDDPLSLGCHRLIKEGATIVSSPQELLEEMGQQIIPAMPPIKPGMQKSIFSEKGPDPHSSSNEKQILQICKEATSIEELQVKIDKDLNEIQMLLFNLQLEGLIEQDYCGLWQAK